MKEGRNVSFINCSEGLLLPCWKPLENVPLPDRIGRGLIYALVLMYLFIGVSIISDRFMAAIEVITSQEREVSVRKTNGDRNIVVVRVWNETVANLTLMALGSSAPEILLSVIEIWAKEFNAGELGPGTIVGSAAYNLFVIIAICVVVIPNGEVRKIKHLRVFFVTASFSVFAYVWLYIILAVISPSEVEVWEAVLTFAFFPATVLIAYAADRRMYKMVRKSYRMNRRGVIVQAEGMDALDMGQTEIDLDDVHEDAKQEYVTTLKELRRQHPNCDLDSLERMAHELLLNRGPKSRAFYRIQATRKLMGSGDLLRRISERAQSDLSEVKAEIRRESGTAEFNPSGSRVCFEPCKYTVLESCGRFEIRVARSGDIDGALSVQYCTEDGSATSGSDYIPAKGTLHFGPGEKEKKITLEVIDDDVFEPDEHFYVRLNSAQPAGSLMTPTLATIVILDDDHGGVFKFPMRDFELVESVGVFELKVVRCSGARGRVVIPYWTEDGTAKSGKEYEAVEGEVIFENNESDIQTTLVPKHSTAHLFKVFEMRSIFGSYDTGINHQLPQIIAILSGSLAGVSNGLLLAWTSPSIPRILDDNSTDISFEEASYFTVIPPISMALTAPLFAILVDIIGRKMGVLLVAVPYLIAWILIAVSKNLWIFYFSRVVAGVGDAMLFATSPIYVCEIAEPSVRGTWGNMVAISIYIGIFLINVIGAYNNILVTALICGFLPILHVVIFYFMPESPYFLVMKDRDNEAVEALRMLRWRYDVDKELSDIKADVKRQVSEKGSLKDLFTITSNRRALVMCMGIRVAQQFSGLPAFEVYTQYLFQEAGGSVSDKTAAMIFSGTLALMVALSSYLVERYGRRPLMIWSCLGCGLTLVVETVYFAVKQFTDVDLSNFGWLPLAGMLAYIIICSTGIGILPTLILGEIFSTSIKGKATAVMNVVLAGCLLAVPKLFQYLTFNFGIYSPFCCFTACCFAAVFFSYFLVIETKGKTLEEIQQELKGNKLN